MTTKKNQQLLVALVALFMLSLGFSEAVWARGERGGAERRGFPGGVLQQLIFPCQTECRDSARECVEDAEGEGITCLQKLLVRHKFKRPKQRVRCRPYLANMQGYGNRVTHLWRFVSFHPTVRSHCHAAIPNSLVAKPVILPNKKRIEGVERSLLHVQW